MSGPQTESLFLSFFKSFLIALADKPAVWYSLKPISNDVPSLPGLLNLSYDQMLHILDVCGLWDVSGNLFKFKKMAFFIDSNSLQEVVEHTKVSLRSSKDGPIVNHHVLCIGDRSLGIANKPCCAPKVAMRPIRTLTRLQNEFREKITKACRQFLVDGGMATEFKGTNNEKNTLGKFMNSLGLQIETEKEGITQNEQDRNVGDGCSLLLEPSELVVDDEDLLHF